MAGVPALAPGARPVDVREYHTHRSDRTHHSSREGVHGMEEDLQRVLIENRLGDLAGTILVIDHRCPSWGENHLLGEIHLLGGNPRRMLEAFDHGLSREYALGHGYRSVRGQRCLRQTTRV
jgi:hypothetical protein